MSFMDSIAEWFELDCHVYMLFELIVSRIRMKMVPKSLA